MVAARQQQHATFTEREYLALEAVAEIRHEYCHGYVVAKVGEELAHNLAVSNLIGALGQAIGDGQGAVLGSTQRVKAEALGEYYYPTS